MRRRKQRQRDHRLMVNFTEAEQDAIYVAADDADLSVPQYVKNKLFGPTELDWRIEVRAYGLDYGAANRLFASVADVAHADDKDVSCSMGPLKEEG